MLVITSAKKKKKDKITTPKGESQKARHERCVKHVKEQQGGKAEGEYNAYAVCGESVGKPKKKKK